MNLFDIFSPENFLRLVPGGSLGFRSGGGGSPVVQQAPTRAQPPPAPAPLSPSRPTQSVSDILLGRRSAGQRRTATVLTSRDAFAMPTASTRRTLLGTPVAVRP